MNWFTKQKQTHRLKRTNMVVGSVGENGGKRQGVWDGHIHIHAVFKMNSEQGPTVQCREFCSMYTPAWMGGEAGGEWKHVCMAESLRCPPETITTLLIGYIPKQNKKFKKINNYNIYMLKFKTSILSIHWHQTVSTRGYKAREGQLQELTWGWGVHEKADRTGDPIRLRISDLLADWMVMSKYSFLSFIWKMGETTILLLIDVSINERNCVYNMPSSRPGMQ